MRTHGKGRACYHLRTYPACDPCRTEDSRARYARLTREAQTPGTYRYGAIHGIGMAGEKQNDNHRKYKRAVAQREDDACLA